MPSTAKKPPAPSTSSHTPTCPRRNAVQTHVTFCAIQLELADDAEPFQSEDIEYNRGKSLEDVFSSLTLLPDLAPEDRERNLRENRGQRTMDKLEVKTFSRFDAMDAESKSKSASKESTPSTSDETERSKESKESTPSAASASTSTTNDPDVIKFVSGNPFVEVTKGVIHLYKENQPTSLEEGVIRSPMLCMLGVSANIKTLDLLQFTAPSHEYLEMMRIIQDSSPNQYMVLLRFKCQEAADEFYKAFNGVRFNSFEEDVCSLVYVSKVETCKESEYYPLAGHTELPLCSICLESMT